MKHFIITGTSRGIGEEVSKVLLEEENYVYGISRGDSTRLSGYKRYHHYNYVLSYVSGIESLLSRILNQMNIKIK